MRGRLATSWIPVGPLHRRIISKPSKHYGTDLWCYDGPMNGRMVQYRGKRIRITLEYHEVKATGEYVHMSRPVGNRQGYEQYYQWYGPTAETMERRREQMALGKVA